MAIYREFLPRCHLLMSSDKPQTPWYQDKSILKHIVTLWIRIVWVHSVKYEHFYKDIRPARNITGSVHEINS